mmetsp:Transcript_8476/g.10869  ORF Transcript_8476/g.10869 Transcript_8476/m.10869 type:complete len:205 (+) Transcript_8476:378-992(+)
MDVSAIVAVKSAMSSSSSKSSSGSSSSSLSSISIRASSKADVRFSTIFSENILLSNSILDNADNLSATSQSACPPMFPHSFIPNLTSSMREHTPNPFAIALTPLLVISFSSMCRITSVFDKRGSSFPTFFAPEAVISFPDKSSTLSGHFDMARASHTKAIPSSPKEQSRRFKYSKFGQRAKALAIISPPSSPNVLSAKSHLFTF